MEADQLWRQYFIAGVASIASVSGGFMLGWTSPVTPKLGDLTTSPLPETLDPSSDQVAWIGSLLSVGVLFGPIIGGFAATHVGRKWGLLSSIIPMFIGWILIAAATNVAFMYSGRIFWGIAVGMIFTVSPMYCAEIATDDSRGALGSFLQAFGTLGFLLVYSVGPFVSYSVIAYVGACLVAVFAVSFFFMPESPTYYLLKNDRESAKQCLALIRGRSAQGVEEELSKTEAYVRESQAKTATLMDVFRGNNFKALYITCALIFFQLFSGINAVLFYMTPIFNAAGSGLDSAIATIIIGAVQVVASLMTPLVVDRLGRRILLLISSGGTAIGIGLLGMYYLLDELESPATASLGWLPLASLILFMVTYCWGLGPLPWALMGELFPIEVKAIASPIVTAFSGVLNFLVTRFFSSISNLLGMYTAFWIFSGCSVLSFFFTLFVVPETKNKSFQEIQVMLSGGKTGESEKALFEFACYIFGCIGTYHQVVASLMTPLVVDRLGRRILLLISSCGMAIGLGLLGMYYLLDELESPATASLGWLPLASLILFIVTYCWGLAFLPWTIMSELYSIEVKAIATPMVATFYFILGFFVTRFFSSVSNVWGMYTVFWIFGGCCVLSFFFTLFFVPETKNKSFQEIQIMLSGGKPEEREKK